MRTVVRTLPVLIASSALALGWPIAAQVQVRSSALFERYSFEDGLVLSDNSEVIGISEIAIPIAMTLSLGRRASVTLSTAYARVELESVSDGNAMSRVVTGLTDIEGRLSIDVIPERLVLFAAGGVPLGNETLAEELRPIAAVLAVEALDFSIRSLGTGGNVGFGVAGAVPAGDYAIGFAGSLTRFNSFEPASSSPVAFQPGSEARIRLGLEGAPGDRSYLRLAGIFSRRGEDLVEDLTLGTPGNRFAFYGSLDQAVGRSALTIYVLDAFRSSPQIEQGTLQPRGNLLAAGGQMAIPIDRSTSLLPRFEFRQSLQALDPESESLTQAGRALRIGADLSRRMARGVNLTLEAEGVLSTLDRGVLQGGLPDARGSGESTAGTGFRAGLHLEVRR